MREFGQSTSQNFSWTCFSLSSKLIIQRALAWTKVPGLQLWGCQHPVNPILIVTFKQIWSDRQIKQKNKLSYPLNTGVLEYASNILGRVIFLRHNKRLRQKLLQSPEMKIKEFRVTLPMTVEEYQVPLVKTDTTMNIEQWTCSVTKLETGHRRLLNSTRWQKRQKMKLVAVRESRWTLNANLTFVKKISEHSFLGKKITTKTLNSLH